MATGIREYQPGDRFSWIHWKTFARTNELMTKEFEERQSHDVLIVLDRESSQAFEAMVTFTASMIRSIVKKRGSGRPCVNWWRSCFISHPGRRALESAELSLGESEAGQSVCSGKVLQGAGLNYSQSAAVLFVTSSVSKKMIMSVNEYAKRNSSVVIFLVKKGRGFVHGRREIVESLCLLLRHSFTGML